MKVVVYVNWRDEEIITEKEYKEKIKEIKKDKENFEDYKDSYLNDYIKDFLNQSPYPECFDTVFNFTEVERQKILDKVKEGYEYQVEQDMTEDWDKIEIDI